jgi:hypothetical protein
VREHEIEREQPELITGMAVAEAGR